jgi:hypothetical protein
MLLALLFLIPQDCEQEHPNRDGLSTDDLVEALEAADIDAANWRASYHRIDLENDEIIARMSLVSAEWEFMVNECERAGQAHVLNTLERVLVQRFIEPLDLWMSNPHVTGHPFPRFVDGECWYAIVIQPLDALKSDPVWLKFPLETKKYGSALGYGDDKNESILQLHYKRTMRKSILDSLEHHLVLLLDQPECVTTLITGTPHLYRLTFRESNIEHLRKEDRIY